VCVCVYICSSSELFRSFLCPCFCFNVSMCVCVSIYVVVLSFFVLFSLIALLVQFDQESEPLICLLGGGRYL